MGKFNFDAITNRKETDSIKWNMMDNIYGTNDLLPMWVADMDFQAPTEVTEALMSRVAHGVFGYAVPTNSLHQAVKNWVQNRYHWTVHENWFVLSSGVVTSIALTIRALTKENGKVLIQTPVYPPFYSMIEMNNREIVKNPLKYENGKYEIDFADFEEKLKTGVKLFILCNPHNPVGRVWTKEELDKMGSLCEQYGVQILSDEIHGDLVFKPHVHIPIASIKEGWAQNSVTCIAPSKTFNIPGIQSSVMIIPNNEMREKVMKEQQKVGSHGLNIFGNVALEAAYAHGEEWLEELLDYVKANADYVKQFLKDELPALEVLPLEGTYLLWINCRKLGFTDEQLKDRLINIGRLALEPGIKYGDGGEGFVRMNIGCPRETLLEGLQRLKKALQ
ncbi:MalY/PatB family protein [Bacillus kwashiorkori]|uniref:MalY/PatB family protein n=1 Tax=Bacillus kwashiorkori TaxID=1522318 RepID=UPI000784E83E|nr:MalY/PatB family protein [Bacillus kwashiorkori]